MNRLLAPLGFVVLGACSMSTTTDSDLARACIAELAAEGTYRWNPADPVPVVIPGVDGTQRTADNINACIRRKADASI